MSFTTNNGPSFSPESRTAELESLLASSESARERMERELDEQKAGHAITARTLAEVYAEWESEKSARESAEAQIREALEYAKEAEQRLSRGANQVREYADARSYSNKLADAGENIGGAQVSLSGVLRALSGSESKPEERDTHEEARRSEHVERYIRGLEWGDDASLKSWGTPDGIRTIVAGNIRAFASWLKNNPLAPSESKPCEKFPCPDSALCACGCEPSESKPDVVTILDRATVTVSADTIEEAIRVAKRIRDLPESKPSEGAGEVLTNCPECGPGVSVDEDVCCTMCGRDALVWPASQPSEPSEVEREGEVIECPRCLHEFEVASESAALRKQVEGLTEALRKLSHFYENCDHAEEVCSRNSACEEADEAEGCSYHDEGEDDGVNHCPECECGLSERREIVRAALSATKGSES